MSVRYTQRSTTSIRVCSPSTMLVKMAVYSTYTGRASSQVKVSSSYCEFSSARNSSSAAVQLLVAKCSLKEQVLSTILLTGEECLERVTLKWLHPTWTFSWLQTQPTHCVICTMNVTLPSNTREYATRFEYVRCFEHCSSDSIGPSDAASRSDSK